MRACAFYGLIIALFAASAAPAAVVYVDAAHCPSGDGTTWDSAFCTIQEGIDAAGSGDAVFVKAGTYPEAIVLKSELAVLGGFAGTESTPEQRDLAANETIIDATTLARPVRAVLLDGLSNTQLDAFTIRGADSGNGGGSGLYAVDSAATCAISNCRFEDNTTTGDGGGAFFHRSPVTILSSVFEGNTGRNAGALNLSDASGVRIIGVRFTGNRATNFGGATYQYYGQAVLESCVFEDNSASSGGGAHGFNAQATFAACTFTDNSAPDFGGGISWYGVPVTVERCIFVGNSAGTRGGGGLEVHETNCSISDSLFSQNTANGDGGAMRFDDGDFEVTHCTIVDNSSTTAGGGIAGLRGSVRIRNTILVNNEGSGAHELSAAISASSCLFEGNTPYDFLDADEGGLRGAGPINAQAAGSLGNVSGDPLFTAPAALDFHLRGGSVAIAAANGIYATDTDLDGRVRPGEDGVPDIGAYEFYDEVAPNVFSITRAGLSPTNGATVQFVVRFDESVQGVGANDFQIASGDFKAVSGAAVVSVEGERDLYLVTVNTGTGDGTLRLDLIDNDSILDLANNLLGGPGNGNGSFVTGEAFIIDKTAPVISLAGDPDPTLEAGSFFVEPGLTAIDNLDGDITNRVAAAGLVDIGELGVYPITYTVSDTAGNAATAVTRTVTVVDTLAPVIVLLGENPVDLAFGEAFSDPGAFAFDQYDGDVSAGLVVEAPDEVGAPGSYEFVFRVSDSSGNEAVAIRVVNVTDDQAPVITILGEATVEVQLGEAYTDAGATASDNVDGDLTAFITVESDLTTAVPGTYPITYRVADAAGNLAEAVRTVVVLDRPDFYVTPEIQFISSFARTVAFDVYNRSTAPQAWRAEVIEGGEWCTIVAGETGTLFYGQIYARAEDNNDDERRVAKIQISTDEKFALPIVVQVSQAPVPKGVLGCGDSGPADGAGGDLVLVALLAGGLLWQSRKSARA